MERLLKALSLWERVGVRAKSTELNSPALDKGGTGDLPVKFHRFMFVMLHVTIAMRQSQHGDNFPQAA